MPFIDRRSLLFAMLYFCEGAPIGFLWWTLPAYWKVQGLAVDEITSLTFVLVLPWTLKWTWAPLVDWSSRWWPYRRWVISAQILMGITLLAVPAFDPQQQRFGLVALLLAHAFSAATQDVAIDALCISTVSHEGRGSVNGWMQAGMLLGRALFGGGALIVAATFSLTTSVFVLVGVLWTVALILAFWRSRTRPQPEPPPADDDPAPLKANDALGLIYVLRDWRIWFAVAFALVGGAAFESVGALLGPFLVSSGMDLATVGKFQMFALAGVLAVGALVGGRLGDKLGHVRVAACSLMAIVFFNLVLGGAEILGPQGNSLLRLATISAIYLAVGVFTASSYALFMDLAASRWKAAMFSGFMAATNVCEAASTWSSGQLASRYGYGETFIMMTLPSLVGLVCLRQLRRRHSSK